MSTAAAASVGAAALAAARVWRERSGRWQEARIDVRHASVAFRSERYQRIGGEPPHDRWQSVSGYYRTGDDRFIQLHCNFPNLRDRALGVLEAKDDRAEVERAVGGWRAAELEEVIVAAGGCAYMLRSRDEWLAHPQSEALATQPLLTIARHEGSAAEPLPPGETPLAGVRVLDLTRVIAGPICGRTLAAYGADVLRVGADHLPVTERLVIDTGFGKRFAHVDLRTDDGRERLRELVRGADVVVQSYRPGALAGRGFGFEDIAALRPGIVHASLSAWSREGPWADRRGYDSLVQTASGIAHEGGVWAGEDGPQPLPAQALDHASGYLLAAAAMIALVRRVREGGSHEVRVSLAQAGRWIDGLGRIDDAPAAGPDVEEIGDLTATMPSAWGELQYVRPAGVLSETPPAWVRPPPRPGSDEPAWLQRG